MRNVILNQICNFITIEISIDSDQQIRPRKDILNSTAVEYQLFTHTYTYYDIYWNFLINWKVKRISFALKSHQNYHRKLYQLTSPIPWRPINSNGTPFQDLQNGLKPKLEPKLDA